MPTDEARQKFLQEQGLITTGGTLDITACGQVIKELSAPAVEFFLKLLGRSTWDL